MANPDDKGTVTFPENDEYLQRIQAAKAGRVPVGGVPMPNMPRFDQPLPTDRHAGVEAPMTPGDPRGIMSKEQMEELQRQGKFIPGVGAGYAFNQPGAQVGKNDDPNQMKPAQGQKFANPPRPSGAGLRPETVEQLQAVATANPGPAQESKPAAEKSKEEKAADKEAEPLDDFEDQFDIDEFGQKVRNLLVNKERRDAIEKRCVPMNIEELLTAGEIRQNVPIIPGVLEVMFRSMSGAEDLFVKRRLFGVKATAQTVFDTFTVMNLTCSVHAINRRPLPSHLDKEGDIQDVLFDAKYKILLKMPIQMLADLSVNYSWFDRRVKRLFVTDEIKGF